MGFAHRSVTLLLVCAGLMVTLSMGIRHGFGLFLQPMSADMGWGREVFSFALALQNLVWGLAQPFTGLLADRYGAGRVLFAGALLYAAGLLLMADAASAVRLAGSAGLLVGLGLSGTTFSIVYGVVGRAVAPEKRSMALGITGAAGSFGQFVMVPGAQSLIAGFGWQGALLALAAVALLMAPLAGALAEPRRHAAGGPAQSLSEAVREAARHRGFWLLTLGFFVCGFQVVFIGAHFPAFIADHGLSGKVGMTALALIGLFNVFGTWGAGLLGGRHSKKRLLAMLYVGRSVAIALLLAFPVSALSATLFGAVMGLLWLGTVPLTNGLVAQIFGVRYFSMLAGFVFFSHQIGSFLGAWLGGLIYDSTGSYTLVWAICIVLGLLAAALHLPIDERPLARVQAA